MPTPVEPPQFSVETRPAREHVIVVPHGELDLATTGRVAEAIDGVVASGFTEVVLDLRHVTFMDSTGLRLTIAQARRTDARVRMVDGVAAVARVFELTRLRDELPFLSPQEVQGLPD